MYIVTNTTKIRKDEGYKLVDRFDKVGKVEYMEGFLGLEVMLADKLKDYDEVSVVTRWENEAAFKNWVQSDAFKESHSHKGGGKPDYILSNKISFQNVRVTRNPILAH